MTSVLARRAASFCFAPPAHRDCNRYTARKNKRRRSFGHAHQGSANADTIGKIDAAIGAHCGENKLLAKVWRADATGADLQLAASSERCQLLRSPFFRNGVRAELAGAESDWLVSRKTKAAVAKPLARLAWLAGVVERPALKRPSAASYGSLVANQPPMVSGATVGGREKWPKMASNQRLRLVRQNVTRAEMMRQEQPIGLSEQSLKTALSRFHGQTLHQQTSMSIPRP